MTLSERIAKIVWVINECGGIAFVEADHIFTRVWFNHPTREGLKWLEDEALLNQGAQCLQVNAEGHDENYPMDKEWRPAIESLLQLL